MAASQADSETTPLSTPEEAVRLRSARAGKLSHVTRRMNIVNNLMEQEGDLEDVKGNFSKLKECFEEFNILHLSCVEYFEEEARKEDHEKWYQPKVAHVEDFLIKVSDWIVQSEKPEAKSDTPLVSPDASTAVSHETHDIFLIVSGKTPDAPMDNPDAPIPNDPITKPPDAPMDNPDVPISDDPITFPQTGGSQVDLGDAFATWRQQHGYRETDIDTRSTRSGSSRSSRSSSSSLRLNAEAERAALVAKAARLQEKHAIEEQEQLFRKRREALELTTEIEAADAKISFLQVAEGLTGGSVQSATEAAEVVRLRPGVQVQFFTPALSTSIQQPQPLLGPVPKAPPTGSEPQSQVKALQATAPIASSAIPSSQSLQAAAPIVSPAILQPPLHPRRQHSQAHDTQPTGLQPQSQTAPPAILQLQPQQGTFHRGPAIFSQPQSQPQQATALSALAPTFQPQPQQATTHSASPAPFQPQYWQASAPSYSIIPQFQPQQIAPQGAPISISPQTGASSEVPPTPSSPQDGQLTKILETQNELTKSLVKQQLLSTLPQGSIPIFDGQVLEYRSFIHTYEHMIESKTDNDRDRLQFLIQYTRGQAQKLVKSCEYMAPERGYQKAKQLLRENYGHDYQISCAYLDKALSWPPIKAEDPKSLQDYAMFLRSCCNALEDMAYTQELDTVSNMRSIAHKLPFKLREKWRNKAYDQEEHNQRVRVLDLVSFIEKQARMVCHPVFGDLQGQSASREEKARPPAKPQVSKSAGSFVTSVATVSKEPKSEHACPFCNNRHTLEVCRKFAKLTHRDKICFIKSKGICFGCLTAAGHLSSGCTKRLICSKCKKAHPSQLHIDRKEEMLEARSPSTAAASVGKASSTVISTGNYSSTRSPSSSAANPAVSSAGNPTSSVSSAHIGAGEEECPLFIVPVKVKASMGSQVSTVYALLDPGSSATFCSENLMSQLNLKAEKRHILLRTLNQEKSVPTHVITGLEVSALDSDTFLPLPTVFTQKEMPVKESCIPRQEDLTKWPYLGKVKLPSISAKVELLIGINAPKLLEPWEVINSQGEGPYAVRTQLGWVVNGPLRGGDCTAMSVTANRISVTNIEELLISQYNQEFSELASNEKAEMSMEDKRFLEVASEAVLQDGHYSLKLPFRKANVNLPNNRPVAEQRLQSLKMKMEKDQKFKQEYVAFLNDILESNYAEKVPEEELSQTQIWYVPHHGVYHPKKKKLRVVFDCAASYKGASLNTELLQGPDLTNSLIGVLLRFRKEPVGMMADIKSIFYQVRVDQSQVDYMRFLWWPQGDTSQSPAEYRMLVHIFGAVSSPSCASYALRQTANDYQGNFLPQVAQTIRHNFYVDDCVTSVATEPEAIQLVKDLTSLCSKGGFQLTQWVSNSRAVLTSIPQEQKTREVRTLDLDKDSLPIERALGLQWCVDSDTFQFNINLSQKPHTRRGILSVVSSIFDPLGFLAPLILPGKQLLQELCQKNFGWDEPLPKDLLDQWMDWTSSLKSLTCFSITRCLKPEGHGTTKCAQLHHFADASEVGYGTVSYIRQVTSEGFVHVTVVLGKARVLPLKPITIPRLELAAAVLSVKVDKMLRKEMHLDLQPSVFWTDSQTVLKYIRNNKTRFKTYVSNRVSHIRDNTDLSQWRYVGSKDNPADDASRGLSAGKFLQQRRWIHGPDFLSEPEESWPTEGVLDSMSVSQDDPEVRRNTTVLTTVVVKETETPTNQLISFFSDWLRLLKAVAWFLKLKNTLMLLANKRKELSPSHSVTRSHDQEVSNQLKTFSTTLGGQRLTVIDVSQAERSVISYVQGQTFPVEIATLKSSPSNVKKSSNIARLDPVLDEGLLRVGGRLHRSAMPDEAKHPCILPKDAHISVLILRHIHVHSGHSGRNHMLSELRKKYWIIKGNSAARKVISKCVVCRRARGKMGEQKMSDLPRERILPDLPPFTNVGLDYFGPITVRRGRSEVKRYGVLFTCMSSRAVHLEVAYSLDTDSCIHALRRFVCRRGQVKHIRSDNGTNLVGAQAELKKAVSSLDERRIQGALLSDGIQWSFNPPAASHHGGVWERLIRSVRQVLNSTLHQQTIDDEGLHTMFCEAEAILNSRPLSTVSSDPHDLEPLTPNHILLLKSQPILPPGTFLKSDLYARRRWKQVQYMADLFWHRWSKEYLVLLQERQKWTRVKENLKEGDVVLVVDPTAPRGSWPLGRVLETKPDGRGLVRSVKLQTQTSVLERPITKLCRVLETED